MTVRSPKSDDRPAQNQKFFEKALPAAKSNSRLTVQEIAMKLSDRFTFDLSPFTFDSRTLLSSTSIFFVKKLFVQMMSKSIPAWRHDRWSISAWRHDRPAQNQKFFEKALPAARSNSRLTVQEIAMKLSDRFTFDLSPFAFDWRTLLSSTSIFSLKSSSYKWWAKIHSSLTPRPLQHFGLTPRPFVHLGLTPRPFGNFGMTPRPFVHFGMTPRPSVHPGPCRLDATTVCPCGLTPRWPCQTVRSVFSRRFIKKSKTVLACPEIAPSSSFFMMSFAMYAGIHQKFLNTRKFRIKNELGPEEKCTIFEELLMTPSSVASIFTVVLKFTFKVKPMYFGHLGTLGEILGTDFGYRFLTRLMSPSASVCIDANQKAQPIFSDWGTFDELFEELRHWQTVGTVCYRILKKCNKTKKNDELLKIQKIGGQNRPKHSAPSGGCPKPPMVRACRKKEHRRSEPKHLDSKRSSKWTMRSFSKIVKMMSSKTTQKSCDGSDRRVRLGQKKCKKIWKNDELFPKRRTFQTWKSSYGLNEELLIVERTRPSESKVLAVPTKIVENIKFKIWWALLHIYGKFELEKKLRQVQKALWTFPMS